ncbi:MAG: ADP-ribosylglycohydrolase family protein, partial [Cyclobacteriaceae bacterium]|nr:ADP-ribosylglycohydrolase family protein [Cyclobacteriaceae bacterium]
LGKQWVANQAGTWGSSEQARLNIEKGINSPDSGHPRYNRLWFTMGNQARGELPGMMNPGMPNSSAQWARKLGRVNSYAEGTDGGIWVAGMISLAFVEIDVKQIVKQAVKLLNPQTPHHQCIHQVIAMAEDGKSFRQIVDYVEDVWHIQYPASNNTVANAGIVAASVWFGEGDFLKTVNLAYGAADFVDTDNNAAISGAVVAASKGLNALPPLLVAQLNNKVKGQYIGPVKLSPPVDETISNLAKRTVKVAEQIFIQNNVKIEKAHYLIKVQIPIPMEAELWKLADFTQYWNPSWKLERAGFGAPGGGVRNLRGGTYLIDDVLVTYPRDEVRGVVLRGDFEIEKNDVLKLEVAADPGRAWQMLVYVNNEKIFTKKLDGGATMDWKEMPPQSYPESEFVAFKQARKYEHIEVPLGQFAGQQVHIRLYQYTLLLNKIPGNAYWKKAEIVHK